MAQHLFLIALVLLMGSVWVCATKSYTVQSVVSTVTMETSCQVKVSEEIVMKMIGDFGRIERAICDSNLPKSANFIEISNLTVTSNYSKVERTETKLGSKCFSISAFLRKRTPKNRSTTVKFTFNYWIKGPFTTRQVGDDPNEREFELGWNMKFKSGLVQNATFRVEYYKDFYESNTIATLLNNGIQRFEKNFTKIPIGNTMSINLKGKVKSSLVETCQQTIQISNNTLIVSIVVIAIFLIFFRGKPKPTVTIEKKSINKDNTVEKKQKQQEQHGYHSDGGDAD